MNFKIQLFCLPKSFKQFIISKWQKYKHLEIHRKKFVFVIVENFNLILRYPLGCGFILKNGNFIMAMRFFTVYIHANVKNIFWKFFRGRLPTGDGRFKIRKRPTVKNSTLSDCSEIFFGAFLGHIRPYG